MAWQCSFLFSFLNPVHEEMLARRLAELPNGPFISISSKILPEFREYERTSTVVVNSYVGPVMARYLTQLESVLGRGLRIMQSSGGSITASLAAEQPVRTILSGPAGGVVGAFYTGVQAGYPDIITLDMGGTSTDVSLCPGRIKETTSANLGGYPVSVPMIEIHTVGAGGGSIARVDAGGALVVGPQSAGADPGPACYGRGDRITVTDANLTLGRLRPDGFLGGRMTLDLERSRALLGDLAAGVGASATDTALGIIRVVNSNMERAIRAISLERGYDPREFTLVPFGGAGPMHACELAGELGIPRVLVPGHPGILSALGVAIADVVKDYSRTVMLKGGDLDQARLDTEFRGMERLARGRTTGRGIAGRRYDGAAFPGRALRGAIVRADGGLPCAGFAGEPYRPHRIGLLRRPPATVRLRRRRAAHRSGELASQAGTGRSQAGAGAGGVGGYGCSARRHRFRRGGVRRRAGQHCAVRPGRAANGQPRCRAGAAAATGYHNRRAAGVEWGG